MRFNSSKPIFIQLAEYYEQLIDLGMLKENEEMPSVREVALMNDINPNTVQRAFTLMVEHHYLVNIPKKGFFVLKHEKNKMKMYGQCHCYEHIFVDTHIVMNM